MATVDQVAGCLVFVAPFLLLYLNALCVHKGCIVHMTLFLERDALIDQKHLIYDQ